MPVFEVLVRIGVVGEDVNEDGVRSLVLRSLYADGSYWSRNIIDVKRVDFQPPWSFVGSQDDGECTLEYTCEYAQTEIHGIKQRSQSVAVGSIWDSSRAAEIVAMLNEAEHRKWRDTYGEASI